MASGPDPKVVGRRTKRELRFLLSSPPLVMGGSDDRSRPWLLYSNITLEIYFESLAGSTTL